jgi:bifunctional NMN adenylyltransferase/nudix hydrolase
VAENTRIKPIIKETAMIPTVDIAIVIARREIVLIGRAKPPFADRLVLPGGHVDPEDEDNAHAAARELKEEIGLDIDPGRLSPLMTLDRPNRDPRPGTRISEVFILHLDSREDVACCAPGSDAASLHVREIGSLTEEEIGFDHFEAIRALS